MIDNIRKQLKHDLDFAMQRMAYYYDRKYTKPPPLEEGDKVFFLIRNLKIKRTNKKLDFKKVGLFKITRKVITLNYKLALPSFIRLRTNVFYIALLKLVYKNAKLDIYTELEDYEEKFVIEIVLDLRVS